MSKQQWINAAILALPWVMLVTWALYKMRQAKKLYDEENQT
jgi:hypothetical protein